MKRFLPLISVAGLLLLAVAVLPKGTPEIGTATAAAQGKDDDVAKNNERLLRKVLEHLKDQDAKIKEQGRIIKEQDAKIAALNQEVHNAKVKLESFKVKDVKTFSVLASVDTTENFNTVEIEFPERVDFVAMEAIEHDGHDIFWCKISRVNEKRFSVDFRSARGQGNRIVMNVRYVGIQLAR